MRYTCLIIDHDDTAVDSTRLVHYPAHVESLALIRPGQTPIDERTWFEKNFDPGIFSYLTDELGFGESEMEVEHRVWREYTARITPSFYPGFLETLCAFRDQGGTLVVASHSEERVIRNHYRHAANGCELAPDLVFGWELGREKRKPFPYPVNETLKTFGFDRSKVLVLDDLKPGIDMARSAGVDASAAFWSHDIPVIRSFMRENCVATFDTVEEFADFVLR